MNSLLLKNLTRAFVFVLLQGLVLQRIYIGGASFNYFSLIMYPVVIMLLPIQTSRTALVFVGFALGLGVDLFYGSLGVHASACLFIAFIRPMLLRFMEPRGGYPIPSSPVPGGFGLRWFMQYAALMLIAYLLFYFSVEVFTFVYLGQILIKTISTFVLSFLAILAYVMLFNPKS
jgi:hypothetical protein